ncbi:MAG: hypothetical protein IJP62_13880 [Treponema sp.]|nr:hypothetical protein [Treponema sp.]
MAEEKTEKVCDGGNVLAAKTISKMFKFVAAGGIVVCAVLKWLDLMPGATVGEICMMWAVVYGLGAGTIDLNIMFEKFVGRS